MGSSALTVLDQETILSSVLGSDATAAPPLSPANSFIWIDLHQPEPEEIEMLARRFRLDPQIIEDVLQREGRPKLHDYDSYIYVVFHTLHFEPGASGRKELEMCEVDCLLGPDWLITIHPQPVPEFHNIAERWKLRPEWMQKGPGYLLYELMDVALDAYFPILEELDDQIDDFEDRLYRNATTDEDGMVLSSDIFSLKRCLLRMRHVAGPTRDVANMLLRRDAETGGKHFSAFQDLYDHASRIVETIDTYREILSGALDAYLATESNRMNAVMKRLTAYSMILLVPSLLAGIFGMNFEDIPAHHGFFNTVTIMAAVIVGLTYYFKHKRWL